MDKPTDVETQPKKYLLYRCYYRLIVERKCENRCDINIQPNIQLQHPAVNWMNFELSKFHFENGQSIHDRRLKACNTITKNLA